MAKSKNTTVGAFELNNEATFAWTIYVYVPAADGCSRVKTKFKAEFRHVTPERRLEVLQEFRDNLRDRSTVQEESDVSALKDVMSFERMLLTEVLVSFSGIVGADGQELPSSEESIGRLLSNSWARDALLKSYSSALQSRSPEGN